MPRSQRVTRRPVRSCAAELLEDRALLSATFAADTSQLLVTGFTQVTDENLTVREDGANYEFVLSEGTWAGTDGGGVTGAGTDTLVVSKASAGGWDRIGVVAAISSEVGGADIALETADFSTLTQGLSVTGGGRISQGAGETLTVNGLELAGRSISLAGTIDGGSELIWLLGRQVLVSGGTVTSTSGEIRITGNPDGQAGGFAGVTLAGATVRTQTGAIRIEGRGGLDAAAFGDGVRLIGLADPGTGQTTKTTVESTGAGAAAISIFGSTGTGSEFDDTLIPYGVDLAEAVLRSVTGDIEVRGDTGRSAGGVGVHISTGAVIESSGTGAGAATVTIVGRTASPTGHAVRIGSPFGTTAVFSTFTVPAGHPVIRSVSGDIVIAGYGTGRAGVHIIDASIRSTGAGADAADIRIDGEARDRGVLIDRADGVLVAVASVDGDVVIGGASLVSVENDFPGFGGVWIAGRMSATGDGDISVIGYSADGNGAVVLSTFAGDAIGSDLGTITSATGDVLIRADDVRIAPTGRIVSDAGGVTFVTHTVGRTIALGNATGGGGFFDGDEPSGALSLTGLELDRVGTLELRIGDDRAGEIRLVGPVVRRYGAGMLELVTPGMVVDAANDFGPDLFVDGLSIRAAAAGGQQAGILDVSATSFTADVAGWIYLCNAGDLTLGDLAASQIHIFVDGSTTIEVGATLDLDRLQFRPLIALPAGGRANAADRVVINPDPLTPPPRPAPPVTITSSSAEPVVGTFAGLPEGATVATSRGDVARVTYEGGDGNDIVVSLDQPPVVEDERFRIREDETATGDVLANDSDPNDDSLTVVNVNGGSPVGQAIPYAGGLLTVNAGGSFTFDPGSGYDALPPGESRVVTFRYTVSDGTGKMSVGEVTIVVYGDGLTDLVGYVDGEWYVTAYDGLVQKTVRAAQWANVAWDALVHADANGDGRSDVIGLIDGQWWIGYAYGSLDSSAYWTVPVDSWSDAAWRDATLRDLDGDGKVDLLARIDGEWWAALSDGTGGSYLTPTKWATWNATEWDAVFVEDVNADGRSDLIGYLDGEWWVARSNGTGFEAARLWERWADVEWQGLGVFDVNGDGAVDVYGLYGGESYYGMSVDSGVFWGRLPVFSTGVHGYWAEGGNWQDVRAGDFDGDGLTNDLAARSGGDWYVVVSHLPPRSRYVPDRPRLPQSRPAALWADWAEVAWEDVRAGDFDGDGRTDLVGRYAGEWYLARTVAGGGFETDHYATWAETDWRAVAAVEFDELTNWPSPPRSGGSIVWTGGTTIMFIPSFDFVDVVEAAVIVPVDPEPAATAPVASEDDPLGVFWSQAEEDEAFASGLLAGV